jgi:hypothetical protein
MTCPGHRDYIARSESTFYARMESDSGKNYIQTKTLPIEKKIDLVTNFIRAYTISHARRKIVGWYSWGMDSMPAGEAIIIIAWSAVNHRYSSYFPPL